jgi:integration host factor subunit alpha
MSVTKKDIIEQIYQTAGFSKKESAEIVEEVFETIKSSLSNGKSVKVSAFANFTIKHKESRIGRNPQTGEAIEISARNIVYKKKCLRIPPQRHSF